MRDDAISNGGEGSGNGQGVAGEPSDGSSHACRDDQNLEKQERRKVEGDRATEMEGEDRRRDAPAGGNGGRHQRSAIREEAAADRTVARGGVRLGA
ncbi:hypothetical protein BHE74_00037738 [Ensete ventricosum]|nr:hypothetical protein BHE74_00037738 [Ensete ventricosum]RZS02755.1 hypothetical protein BHM03_00032832 [Ensete ventricosum]